MGAGGEGPVEDAQLADARHVVPLRVRTAAPLRFECVQRVAVKLPAQTKRARAAVLTAPTAGPLTVSPKP
jgi:hypothetical protein